MYMVPTTITKVDVANTLLFSLIHIYPIRRSKDKKNTKKEIMLQGFAVSAAVLKPTGNVPKSFGLNTVQVMFCWV